MFGVADGLPRGVDVVFGGSRQPADDRRFRPVAWVAHFNRNPADGFQIVWRSGGEASLDDVHAQAGQVAGYFQLF
jgi:hypothetical protein